MSCGRRMNAALIAAVAACLVAAAPLAAALPQCNASTVNIPGADKLIFAVVGGELPEIDSLPGTTAPDLTRGP